MMLPHFLALFDLSLPLLPQLSTDNRPKCLICYLYRRDLVYGWSIIFIVECQNLTPPLKEKNHADVPYWIKGS